MKKNWLLTTFIVLFTTMGHAQENGNSLLWRLQKNGIDSPSYLFGTIHLPQKQFVNYSDSLYAAIQNSSALYNELDFFHQSIFGDTTLLNYILSKKVYLDSIQKTDAWKRLIDRINKKYNAHLEPDNPDQFLEFSQQLMNSLYQPDEGMVLPDMMLATHALMLGKKTGGLETFQLQFDMLYDIIGARLKDTTMEFEDEITLTEALKKFYVDEELDSIASTIDKVNPLYRGLVFDRRNKTMADSIEQHISQQSCFFAVGAGHLGGSHGVIGLLRQKGFTVTPVHSNNKLSMLVVNNMLKMSGKAKERMDDSLKESKIDTEGTKVELMEVPPPPPPPPPKNVQMKKQPAKTKGKPSPAPEPRKELVDPS